MLSVSNDFQWFADYMDEFSKSIIAIESCDGHDDKNKVITGDIKSNDTKTSKEEWVYLNPIENTRSHYHYIDNM